jgi:hypothetical protein
MSGPDQPRGRDAAIPMDRWAEGQGDPRHTAIKRAFLAAGTAFLAVNLWTGAPLFALWVGSQVEGEASLTMRAVVVVVVVLMVLVVGMTLALSWLSNTYDELIGRPPTERHKPWLRSMRGDVEFDIEGRVGLTALERIVMISVYIAVVSLLIWLIFFAGSFVPSQIRA